MRALGIDFGTKIIGIAISDENKKIASACASITFPKNNYLYAVNQIQKLIKRYDNSVDLIVLGYPLHINGNKSERTFLVEKFYDLLINNIPIKTIFWDERYSTSKTTEMLKEFIELKSSQIKKVKDRLDSKDRVIEELQYERDLIFGNLCNIISSIYIARFFKS